MKKFVLQIAETGRENLKTDASTFNVFNESFPTIEDLKNYLIDRYGKIPKGKNKIHIDGENGEHLTVGFLHSFWNQDISHMSKKWYQTDWITFWEEDITTKFFSL